MSVPVVHEYGPYTLYDLDALPEDGKGFELADGWLTELSPSPWYDHAAGRLKDILKDAARIAEAHVYVAGGPTSPPRQANEFDAVSAEYVAQAKPANFTLNKAFRDQAKATFEVAAQSGRTPYFQFDGPPGPGILRTLGRYADRYGIEPVIDLTPLRGN